MKKQVTTFEDLPSMTSEIYEILKTILEIIKANPSLINSSNSDIISAAELRKRLSITHPTEMNWRKKGYIVAIGKGKKIFYNFNDVLNGLAERSKKRQVNGT